MQYIISRSKRKTVQICIKSDCSVVVKAPLRFPKAEIERFVSEKSEWIEKNVEKMRERGRLAASDEHFTNEEIREFADRALA